MPNFAYKAKKGPGNIQSGVIEAATREEAIDRLSDQGLLPISVEESTAPVRHAVDSGKSAPAAPRPGRAPAAPAAKEPLRVLGRIKGSDITIFSRQLASLLRAGVPILQAFDIIASQTDNPKFKAFLNQAVAQIKDGKPFSSVLSQYPRLFPPIYIALIRVGEDSGSLPETLYRIAAYRQGQEEIRSRIRTAMAYPILMALTGVGTVTFMITFVVPKLSALFTSMGESLPMPTRILIAASAVVRQKFFFVIPAVLAALVFYLVRYQPKLANRWWSRLSLQLPAVKTFTLQSELGRLSRTLHLLIKSGIPILRAIEISAPVLDNSILRAEFEKTHGKLVGGGTLGTGLRESKHFPLFMANLVSVGEESGRLDEALDEIAGYYERETDAAVKVLTSLLEPIMILVMGLVVGFIVIAMLLPMFELSTAVK